MSLSQSQIINELHQRLCSFVKEEQLLGPHEQLNMRTTQYILRIARELEDLQLNQKQSDEDLTSIDNIWSYHDTAPPRSEHDLNQGFYQVDTTEDYSCDLTDEVIRGMHENSHVPQQLMAEAETQQSAFVQNAHEHTHHEAPEITIGQALAFASKIQADAYQVHICFCEALSSASKALAVAADVVTRAQTVR